MATVRFEWDAEKAAINLRKHGVSFEQASELFSGGDDYLEIFDEAHSLYEERFLAIGPIPAGVVVIVHTEVEDDIVRIISARLATKKERDLYHVHIERLDG